MCPLAQWGSKSTHVSAVGSGSIFRVYVRARATVSAAALLTSLPCPSPLSIDCHPLVAVGEQQFSALSLGPVPRQFRSLPDANEAGPFFDVGSPSVRNGILLQPGLTSFKMDASPHITPLIFLDQAASLRPLRDSGPPTALLSGESLYPLCTAFGPPWVTAQHRSAAKGGSPIATTVFGFSRKNPRRL